MKFTDDAEVAERVAALLDTDYHNYLANRQNIADRSTHLLAALLSNPALDITLLHVRDAAICMAVDMAMDVSKLSTRVVLSTFDELDSAVDVAACPECDAEDEAELTPEPIPSN